MYAALAHQCSLSSQAISDLAGEEGFQGLVQGLLKANWGMNWEEWWGLVEWSCRHRCEGGLRMGMEEERGIVLGVIEMWLRREEVVALPEVRKRVEALRGFLLTGELMDDADLIDRVGGKL